MVSGNSTDHSICHSIMSQTSAWSLVAVRATDISIPSGNRRDHRYSSAWPLVVTWTMDIINMVPDSRTLDLDMASIGRTDYGNPHVL